MARNLILLILFSFLLIGCRQIIEPLSDVSERINETYETEKQKQEIKSQAIIKCQELCQEILFSDGQDFDRGPCLSNEIMPGWVCDVAHEPRQEVDNDPANQCPAFAEGKASHFVEVSGNCEIIKVY